MRKTWIWQIPQLWAVSVVPVAVPVAVPVVPMVPIARDQAVVVRQQKGKSSDRREASSCTFLYIGR